MIMKLIAAAAVLSGFASSPVLAATINLGAIPVDGNLSYNGQLGNNNQSDRINFSIVQDTLSTTYAVLNQSTNVTGLVAQLYTSGGVATGAALSTPEGSSTSATYSGLLAGDYYYTVSGTNVQGNAQYTLGLFSSAAAPAPGPAGLAVFGVGAGMLAWQRRRKRRSAAS
ncbi:MAG: hypothetical protein R3E04_13650 [Sphingobium sp.]